jgi:hypothetical protein
MQNLSLSGVIVSEILQGLKRDVDQIEHHLVANGKCSNLLASPPTVKRLLFSVSVVRAREFALSNLQVVAGLEIHPENRCVLKVTRQPQSGIRGDAPAFAHDVGDPRDRHAQVQRKLVHAEAQRLREFLLENLAGVDWLHTGLGTAGASCHGTMSQGGSRKVLP